MLPEICFDQVFLNARSHNGWSNRPVEDRKLIELYELMKWGPTSMNSSPLRVIFIRDQAMKERLKPYLAEGNIAKTLTAPVVAILGYDISFYENLPYLFEHTSAPYEYFSKHENRAVVERAAFQNGTLQAGYFIVAARMLGLDCGPIGGFSLEGVDKEFWADTAIKTNFICNLGYGDPEKIFPRLPRLAFESACQLI